MIHKSFLVAAVITFVSIMVVPVAAGPLAVLAYFLLLVAGITRPANRSDTYALSDADLCLASLGDDAEAGLSERERFDRLVDKLSLRSIPTLRRGDVL